MEDRNLKQEYFDTYEAMTEDERQELILIQKIKSNVKYFVGIDNILNKLIELIDESTTVSFAAERNRKYISKKNPLFVLKVNKGNIKEKLEYFKADTNEEFFIDNHLNPKYEGDVFYIQNKIQKEIIEPYANWLMSYLLDDDKFINLCRENGLDKITISDNALKVVARTSAVMFAIKVDLKNNKVMLEYAV